MFLRTQELLKGDVEGHPFHGNQWKAGDAIHDKVVSAHASYQRASDAASAATTFGNDGLHARVPANLDRARRRASRKLTNAIRTHHPDVKGQVEVDMRTQLQESVKKGDVPGHEFHGNQWSNGAGNTNAKVDLKGPRLNEDGKPDANGDHRETPLPRAKFTRDVKNARRFEDDFSSIEMVTPDQLSSAQRAVVPSLVQEYVRNPDKEAGTYFGEKRPNIPLGVRTNGKIVVLDGNHRAAAALIAGRKLQMKVIDVDRVRAETKLDPRAQAVIDHLNRHLKKGDTPGHDFRGNQFSHGMSTGKAATKAAMWAKYHKAKAEEHTAAVFDKKNNFPERHRHAAEHHQQASSFYNYAHQMYTAGKREQGDAFAGHGKKVASYANDKFKKGRIMFQSTEDLIKGDTPGHEFHGNQFSAGKSTSEAAHAAGQRALDHKAQSEGHLAAGRMGKAELHHQASSFYNYAHQMYTAGKREGGDAFAAKGLQMAWEAHKVAKDNPGSGDVHVDAPAGGQGDRSKDPRQRKKPKPSPEADMPSTLAKFFRSMFKDTGELDTPPIQEPDDNEEPDACPECDAPMDGPTCDNCGYKEENSGENYTYQAKIHKVDEDKRIVYGWASVVTKDGATVEDWQGDQIDEEELLKAAHEFMRDHRVGKEMHDGDQVAEVVESIVMTKDLQKQLGIDLPQVGWLIAMKVHDDEVWKRVKSGELSMFSIGGRAEREEV